MKHLRKARTRSTSSPRKKERRIRARKALATAGAIACGTQAYAEPVRFENPGHGEPGHFHWVVPIGDHTSYLDVIAPADAQPGVPYGNTGLQHFFTGSSGTVTHYAGNLELQTELVFMLVGVDSGQTIPSGSGWRHEGYTAYPGYPTYLPEGEPTYLGFRIDLGGVDHYGWIGVVRTGLELEAFAWGYETEAGVPIAAGAGPANGDPEAIPTMSEYGMMAMGLGVLAAGAWVFKKKLPQPKPA